jgi:hypothetical protein
MLHEQTWLGARRSRGTGAPKGLCLIPVPVVIVDMGPLPAGELPAALIEACSEAVPHGSCVLGEPAPAPEAVYAVARVVWEEPNERLARVWVGVHGEQGPRSATQTVGFEPADQPAERWRAVGFAIGTLIGSEEQAARVQARAASASSAAPGPALDGTAALPSPSGSSPPPSAGRRNAGARRGSPSRTQGAATPTAPEPPLHHPLALSAGALGGPGLDSGMWRFGGLLRADWCFAELPLLVTIAGSYAVRPEDDNGLRASWVTLGAGAGACARVDAIRLGLDARAELVAERFAPAATDAATGAEDSGSRWAPGFRAALDLSWPSNSLVAAVLGADAWALSGSTTVRLAGVEAGAARGLSFALHAGVKVVLPWAP